MICSVSVDDVPAAASKFSVAYWRVDVRRVSSLASSDFVAVAAGILLQCLFVSHCKRRGIQEHSLCYSLLHCLSVSHITTKFISALTTLMYIR